ncbi:MAG: hypothetical protein H6819_04070 [Phycisphaerales bacterium]|nr:hypothetical protein [Phycisphaerales bacterium]MCB9856375.1 hypothetical protein [Phycisphaerales bacterium]MCB9864047.1 hypothetical protein [Phycisphaerales bacterium]
MKESSYLCAAAILIGLSPGCMLERIGHIEKSLQCVDRNLAELTNKSRVDSESLSQILLEERRQTSVGTNANLHFQRAVQCFLNIADREMVTKAELSAVLTSLSELNDLTGRIVEKVGDGGPDGRHIVDRLDEQGAHLAQIRKDLDGLIADRRGRRGSVFDVPCRIIRSLVFNDADVFRVCSCAYSSSLILGSMPSIQIVFANGGGKSSGAESSPEGLNGLTAQVGKIGECVKRIDARLASDKSDSSIRDLEARVAKVESQIETLQSGKGKAGPKTRAVRDKIGEMKGEDALAWQTKSAERAVELARYAGEAAIIIVCTFFVILGFILSGMRSGKSAFKRPVVTLGTGLGYRVNPPNLVLGALVVLPLLFLGGLAAKRIHSDLQVVLDNRIKLEAQQAPYVNNSPASQPSDGTNPPQEAVGDEAGAKSPRYTQATGS